MSRDNERLRVAVFMGTRPEAIKLAPVIRAMERSHDMEPILVSTGQHREMMRPVVDLFDLRVLHDLDAMEENQTLSSLTARLTTRIDDLLEKVAPDLAMVQGDTTSVFVAALVSFYRSIPIAHVEAGLRTFNIHSPFPEEMNRRLTSHVVTLHFAPTELSRDNLRREGVPDERIEVTGNTVIDALQMEIERQREPEVASAL